ncbi:MAG: cytochrome c [Chloroflexota bacterium]
MKYTTIGLFGVLALILAACGGSESVVSYADLPTEGDPVRGEALYFQASGLSPACSACHVAEAAGAPVLDENYPALAAQRVAGQDAHEYTFYAIVEPGQYIVEGYGNAMYNRYDENLEPQDIADLIAYLLEEE